MCTVKFAISPEIRVGGRRFTASDLSNIAELVGEDSDIELTTMQQLIVEMDELRAENAKEALRSRGMSLKILPSAIFVKVQNLKVLKLQDSWTRRSQAYLSRFR